MLLFLYVCGLFVFWQTDFDAYRTAQVLSGSPGSAQTVILGAAGTFIFHLSRCRSGFYDLTSPCHNLLTAFQSFIAVYCVISVLAGCRGRWVRPKSTDFSPVLKVAAADLQWLTRRSATNFPLCEGEMFFEGSVNTGEAEKVTSPSAGHTRRPVTFFFFNCLSE